MLSKLYRDPVHTERAAAHLRRYIERDRLIARASSTCLLLEADRAVGR